MACNMKTSLTALSCLLLLLAVASANRTLNRCGLAREMSQMGVPRDQLARWACIAEHESSFRTWVVGPPNNDQSSDYGIFQINDRYWCQPSNGKHSANGCHINCNQLLEDNIGNSVRCARQVLKEQGWTAWSVFSRHCAGQLPSIDDCFKA